MLPNQSDPDTVNVQFSIGAYRGSLRFKRGWVLDEPTAQVQRQKADWDIDEEYPTPTVVIRDPAAQHRPDGRRGHDYDRI